MSRCRACKREQRAEHLTSDGLCIFCAPVPTWPAKWTQAAEPREVRA